MLFHKKNELVIGETKKSSKYSEASKWQLMFYLSVLKQCGINAKGLLLYPEEKKRTEVILDDKSIEELRKMEDDIESITEKELPPEVVKINLCRNCAYSEYCFA